MARWKHLFPHLIKTRRNRLRRALAPFAALFMHLQFSANVAMHFSFHFSPLFSSFCDRLNLKLQFLQSSVRAIYIKMKNFRIAEAGKVKLNFREIAISLCIGSARVINGGEVINDKSPGSIQIKWEISPRSNSFRKAMFQFLKTSHSTKCVSKIELHWKNLKVSIHSYSIERTTKGIKIRVFHLASAI